MKEQSFIKGALLITLSTVLVKVLGIMYKIPLSYILSDEGMGYFNTAYTIFSFFYIVTSAGVPKAISILVSKNTSLGDPDAAYNVYRAGIRFFSILGLTFTVFFLLLSAPISYLIGNRSSYLSMLAVAPSVFFVSASSVCRGYLTGKLDFIPVAISEIIASFGKLVFGIAFSLIASRYTTDMRLIAALGIMGTTLGAFISWIYIIIIINSKDGKKARQKGGVGKNILKTILTVSLPLTLSAFISNIGSILDLGIIMKMLLKDSYTEYQASIIYGNYTTLVMPMLTSVSALLSPFLLMLIPLISQDATLEKNSFKINIISKIVLIVSTSFSALFAIYPYQILALVFEDTSASLGAEMLRYLSLGIYLMSIVMLVNSVLEGAGKVRVPLFSLITAMLIKTALTPILMKNSLLGIGGVSVATSISYIVSLAISLAFYKKYIPTKNVNIFKNILTTFISVSLSVFLTEFSCKATKMNIFTIKCLIFVFFLVISSYFLVFSKEEKNKILSKVTKKHVNNYS